MFDRYQMQRNLIFVRCVEISGRQEINHNGRKLTTEGAEKTQSTQRENIAFFSGLSAVSVFIRHEINHRGR
jgi:hypothetical protein